VKSLVSGGLVLAVYFNTGAVFGTPGSWTWLHGALGSFSLGFFYRLAVELRAV